PTALQHRAVARSSGEPLAGRAPPSHHASMSTSLKPDSPASTNRNASGLVNCVAYGSDGRRRGDIGLDDIRRVLAEPDGFVWVGLHEPDAALLHRLQQQFDLHDLAIEDADHAHQRPKVEAYGDSLFIALHTAQLVDGHIAFGETHIFLGARFLITV